MKKDFSIECISILLILLFAYTGVSKLLTYSTFHLLLTHQPLTKNYASFLVIAIPIIELGIVACLLMPRFRKWGFIASFILMSVFTLYVAYMLLYLPTNLPCSCGGVIAKMSWPQHMIFNSIFTLLALTGVLLKRNQPKRNDKGNHISAYA